MARRRQLRPGTCSGLIVRPEDVVHPEEVPNSVPKVASGGVAPSFRAVATGAALPDTRMGRFDVAERMAHEDHIALAASLVVQEDYIVLRVEFSKRRSQLRPAQPKLPHDFLPGRRLCGLYETLIDEVSHCLQVDVCSTSSTWFISIRVCVCKTQLR